MHQLLTDSCLLVATGYTPTEYLYLYCVFMLCYVTILTHEWLRYIWWWDRNPKTCQPNLKEVTWQIKNKKVLFFNIYFIQEMSRHISGQHCFFCNSLLFGHVSEKIHMHSTVTLNVLLNKTNTRDLPSDGASRSCQEETDCNGWIISANFTLNWGKEVCCSTYHVANSLGSCPPTKCFNTWFLYEEEVKNEQLPE